jgi:hypothetical protein
MSRCSCLSLGNDGRLGQHARNGDCALAAAELYRPFTNKLDSNDPGHSQPSFAFAGMMIMQLHGNGLARD